MKHLIHDGGESVYITGGAVAAEGLDFLFRYNMYNHSLSSPINYLCASV